MVTIPSTTGEKSLPKPAHFNLDDYGMAQPVLRAQRIFVLLDFDGTLVDIAPTPTEVRLSPERRGCLAELAQAPDVLVGVVSGRTPEEVERILRLEGIFYVGLHGLITVTPQGERVCHRVGQGFIATLNALRREFGGSFSRVPGVLLEDKGLTIALHFRLAKREAALKAKREFIQIAGRYWDQGAPLEILQGKEVLEIKPVGVHKGEAVAFLLDRYGQGAFPVYLGDDVTDKAAFESLRRRGLTIVITDAPRPTAATYYLRDPAEVYGFLQKLVHLRRR